VKSVEILTERFNPARFLKLLRASNPVAYRTSAFNLTLYVVMGVFAAAQIPIAVAVLRKFMKTYRDNQSVYIHGLELGLLVFIIGCLGGVFMSVGSGHTVGAPDGAPGSPS
jgi:hypothetical protein